MIKRPPRIHEESGSTVQETTSRTDLLERCKDGEAAAWQELFSRRAGQIYRWAVLLGLPPSEAEDAAQEVLATAARRIETCQAEEAMTSWLYQITRRIVANVRRSSWWRRWLTTDELPETTAFEKGSQDIELEIRRCLGRLSRKQAEVILLVDIEGFTQAEAAEALGLQPGTVASRLRLARTSFRQHYRKGDTKGTNRVLSTCESQP